MRNIRCVYLGSVGLRVAGCLVLRSEVSYFYCWILWYLALAFFAYCQFKYYWPDYSATNIKNINSTQNANSTNCDHQCLPILAPDAIPKPQKYLKAGTVQHTLQIQKKNPPLLELNVQRRDPPKLRRLARPLTRPLTRVLTLPQQLSIPQMLVFL